MQSRDGTRHHVVFCADRNYLPYFGVAAYSLLSHNARLPLAITLIADDVEAEDHRRLDQLSGEFGVPITIYRITAKDREELGAIKSLQRLGIAAYFRLLIPRVVPESVAKVLYLDSDIIVDGDLSGLVDCAFGGEALGACPDPVGRRLLRKPDYFNSGVMLINLATWRALDVSGKALSLASARSDLAFHDQDALNEIIARDSILWLDPQYNYMVYDRLKPELRAELQRAVGHVHAPKILHFTGQIKPWHGWYLADYKDKYFAYARRSPWHDAPLARDQPANPQQEFWLAEAAEKAADLRKAAFHYKRVAQQLLNRR